jgi:DNA-binding FadR family transcriptional regulator
MTVKFKRTKPVRIFQGVVDQIQGAILEGSLKPGDVLPSEMRLKDMFKTSRGTVREALRVLEQKGLVDIKTGVSGGAVVKSVNTEKLTENLDLLVQCQRVSFDHLAEFREGVEGIVAEMAAERGAVKGLEELERLLAEAREILEDGHSDWKDFARIDVRLHIAIAEMSGNPIFAAVLRMVHERVLESFERFALTGRRRIEENYDDLCRIVEAIAQKRPQDAKALAREHVRRFNRYMKEGPHRPALSEKEGV